MTSNQALMRRRQASVPRGVAHAMPIFAAKAENAEVWDVEGKRYVDFAGGIATLNTGHRHPKVMAAVKAQMDRFTHTAFQVMPYEPYIALAERLNQLAPGPGAKKTLLMTTGAEAIENAIKIARAATGRTAVIAFTGAFHGRTLLTLGLTGKMNPYKSGFGPFPGEIYHVPFPNKLHGVSEEAALDALAMLFKVDVDASRVAAIVIEPVQGEGGFYVAPFAFLQKLRELCTQHGILLIADEIQSGYGRTGRMFAIEHSGVVPDLIVVAKSLAGGMPLSGVVGRAEIMDAIGPGGLGGTYGGNPVACAAGLAVLEVFEEEKLLERGRHIGQIMRRRLDRLAQSNKHPCIGEVRGLGPMLAVELVKDRASNAPDPELTQKITAKAHENGLVLLSCGLYGNVIRMLVPLTASDAIVEEGLDKFEAALENAA